MCHQEKAWLSDRGIAFTERNISEDREARNELIKLGSAAVPVAVIADEVVIGFLPTKLIAALGL